MVNQVDHLGRLEGIDEDDGAGQKWRNENAQHLPEHMTQGQQVQEAQRMKEALVTKVLLDFTLDWLDVGEHIAMRDHHAARLRRSTGGKNDLQRIVSRERGRRIERTVSVGG